MIEADKISPRQAKILAAIVKENSETGQPVASGDLVEKYSFNISSPTIRNEMAGFGKNGLYFPAAYFGRTRAYG